MVIQADGNHPAGNVVQWGVGLGPLHFQHKIDLGGTAYFDNVESFWGAARGHKGHRSGCVL